MRSPPTSRAKSPRIEKLATTLRRVCAVAGQAANAIRTTQASEAQQRAAKFTSGLKMATGKQLPHQAADGAEQHRKQVKHRANQDDRGARRHLGLERQHQ